ncbi:alanyl-tRNA synthetase [Dethiosulfatibacter aminovorans DSM 17477]|uniref:Alanyl-tRNA synthetase n=1 Tax=Dethiosulfatibacter aminovorans DSM 17477 TaxID=1121476 RepID=A0A1M6H0S7_9FIRM|nr:DHHA1 domain-containing protein [Dethiosulfatibacter aminovorans]SHJ15833.1 alanyl-tRNA synthetase [Dethiosulfatibacter aminovorans DSM 17477]
MTKRLFEENVYLKETNCRIIGKSEVEGKKLVELDGTIFFPEGGGQPSDTGTIGEANVLYVFEKGERIYHQVDVFPEGEVVKCILDWKKRLDHMQQHCGEHILSGVMLKEYGFHNKGFHMGEDYITIDIDAKSVTDEMIKNIELKCNEAIYENRNIEIITVDSVEKARDYPIRKMPDIDEDIKIVNIVDTDCVACCGTHPSKTGEVGLVKILRTQKYKGMTRIFFKCGMRAFEDFQREHEIISTLNRKYSSDLDTLIDRNDKETMKMDEMKNDLKSLRKQLSKYDAKTLMEEAEGEKISKLFEYKTAEELDNIVSELADMGSFEIILSSGKDKRIVYANNTDNGNSCGKIFKENIKDYNGRGGGKNERAQGSFADKEDLIKFHNFLKTL